MASRGEQASRRRTIVGDEELDKKEKSHGGKRQAAAAAASLAQPPPKRRRAAASSGGGDYRGRPAPTAAVAAADAPAARTAPQKRVEVAQLEAVLYELKRAEQAQAAADAARAKALQKLNITVPAVEKMVRDAAQTLSAHQTAAPASRAMRAEQAEAQTRGATQAGEVRLAAAELGLHPATGPSQPALVAARSRGEALLRTARAVSTHLEQLHATLAANAEGHNDGKSLALRVLSIGSVRGAVMKQFTLRQLFALRRVCRDFETWSCFEVRTLLPLPVSDRLISSDFKLLSFATGRPEIGRHVIRPPADMPDNIMGNTLVRAQDGSIFLAGGQMLPRWDLNQLGRPDRTSPIRSVNVWRPSARGGVGGHWDALPPLPTDMSHAKGCVVTMADGEEVLALMGGRSDESRSISVMVLRHGTWSTLKALQSYRKSFAVCAMPGGRLAVLGGYVGGVMKTRVHVLDIAQDTWSRLPEIAHGRSNPTVACIRGTLYVVGGWKMEIGADHRATITAVPSCEKHTLGDTKWAAFTAPPEDADGADGGNRISISDDDSARSSFVRSCLVVTERSHTPGARLHDTTLRVHDFESGRWHSTGVTQKRLDFRDLERAAAGCDASGPHDH